MGSAINIRSSLLWKIARNILLLAQDIEKGEYPDDETRQIAFEIADALHDVKIKTLKKLLNDTERKRRV